VDAEQLRQAAHAAVLDGLRAGQSLADIERAVARCRVRGKYEPDLAMLELIIAALDNAEVGRDRPLDISDWRQRFLPEINFRNRHTEVQRLVYALHTAAAFRTGLCPDILDDTYGWGGAALLPYATRAAVMTIRATSAAGDLQEACDRISGSVIRLT
jgi:hypothetical protein